MNVNAGPERLTTSLPITNSTEGLDEERRFNADGPLIRYALTDSDKIRRYFINPWMEMLSVTAERTGQQKK